MDFADTPDEAAFRQNVRRFIGEHFDADSFGGDASEVSLFPPESPDQQAEYTRWQGALSRKGWIAPHWPTQYGGAGMSPGEHFIFNEELATARAPQVGGMGVSHIGPILIRYGTEEQRREHLPRVTAGEVVWSQGYSEPGAGSDLASLQTRAVRDGDDYVVNGEKIWSSGAHQADWMFMLVRTDPEAPKHRGISMLLTPLTASGVTVRPIVDMAGEHHFNQVFFDNVRVPATNLVGEENRGWYVGAALLDLERSMIGPVVRLRHTLEDLTRLAADASRSGANPMRPSVATKAELAERAIETEIARLFSYRVISLQKQGKVPNYEASTCRLFYTETEQRLARTGVALLGLYGALVAGSRHAALAAHQDEFEAILLPWLLDRNRDELFAVLQAHHVMCAPVFDPVEVLENEHYNARGFFWSVDDPVLGWMRLPGPALRGGCSSTPATPAAQPGRDNERVYAGLLGLDGATCSRLRGAGVI